MSASVLRLWVWEAQHSLRCKGLTHTQAERDISSLMEHSTGLLASGYYFIRVLQKLKRPQHQRNTAGKLDRKPQRRSCEFEPPLFK